MIQRRPKLAIRPLPRGGFYLGGALLWGCSGDPFTLDTDAGAAAITAAGGNDPVTPEAPTIEPPPAGSGGMGEPPTVPEVDSGVPLVIHDEETPCGAARKGTQHFALREVCLGPGSFEMGSTEPNAGGNYSDHTPAHSVELSEFFLDAYEVTVGRYRACVEAGGCAVVDAGRGSSCTFTASPGAHEDHPMNCVTWTEAVAFCEWDERRLPTEAEWEFAARSDSTGEYPWGSGFGCDRAVLGGTPGGSCPEHRGPFPKPVGSTPNGATENGVFDLVGNVAEWVHDWVRSYPSAPQTDPEGPVSGTIRGIRSSSWTSAPIYGATYLRSGTAHDTAQAPVGFRCARDSEAL